MSSWGRLCRVAVPGAVVLVFALLAGTNFFNAWRSGIDLFNPENGVRVASRCHMARRTSGGKRMGKVVICSVGAMCRCDDFCIRPCGWNCEQAERTA